MMSKIFRAAGFRNDFFLKNLILYHGFILFCKVNDIRGFDLQPGLSSLNNSVLSLARLPLHINAVNSAWIFDLQNRYQAVVN